MSSIIKGNLNYENPFSTGEPTFKIKPKTIEPDEFVSIESQDDIDRGMKITPEEIIANAKDTARRIIDDANIQCVEYMRTTSEKLEAEFKVNMNKGYEQGIDRGFEEGQKNGRELGYKAGYNDGFAEADDIIKKKVEFMEGVIEGIDDAKHMMLKKYENNLSDVALAMAKMVVKRELELNPKELNEIIKSAASTCKNQEYILVTLSENGYMLITNDDYSVQKTLKTYSDDVRFFVDNNMQDTDCIIETPIGTIDASVKVQLENIENAIKNYDNQDN